jgi:dTDP-4-amino-4,6-dideoxygalactose transaminase
MKKQQIPMQDLRAEYEYMKAEIDAAISRCTEHQKWIFGPEVKAFEDKIAEYLGVKQCIGVCSGTEALVLSLRALAIKTKGQEFFSGEDEIITTPFTFTATGDAILRAGATPVFVDIDPKTYNIDPIKIREHLSSHTARLTPNDSRVVGILPVHLYGQSCDMDEISSVAKENRLFVVEDAAQAFGGGWNEKKLGSIGTLGAFSFFPSKNLGGFGDGGMVSTGDGELAELVRMLLKHGGKDKCNVNHIGYNARLDTLQAAILLAKFKFIDEFNEKRGRIAEMYNKALQGLDRLALPVSLPDAGHVYHQYTIRTEKRDELQKFLKENGVSTMIYYPLPLHQMKVFEGRSRNSGSLTHSEEACKSVLSLPIEPLQDGNDSNAVIKLIKDYYDKE